MKDKSELERVVLGETRIVLTRDLSVMNPNLAPKLANYTMKVQFPRVTVGIGWQDCEIVDGKTGMPTDAEQPRMIPRPRAMGEE